MHPYTRPMCRNLSSNSLNGTVPKSLGSLRNLQFLYVILIMITIVVRGTTEDSDSAYMHSQS